MIANEFEEIVYDVTERQISLGAGRFAPSHVLVLIGFVAWRYSCGDALLM